MDRTIHRARSVRSPWPTITCFAGFSPTDNHPAIQESLEYTYEPWGVYLGTWASNVDTMTSDGEIEIRWFGGFRGNLAATAIVWDLGAVYYHYPGDDLEPEKDYVESKLGLSHEFAGLPLTPRVSASVHHSPDFSPSRELRRWFGHDPDK